MIDPTTHAKIGIPSPFTAQCRARHHFPKTCSSKFVSRVLVQVKSTGFCLVNLRLACDEKLKDGLQRSRMSFCPIQYHLPPSRIAKIANTGKKSTIDVDKI
jgi:hypothetical protein